MSRELLERALKQLKLITFANDSAAERHKVLMQDIQAALAEHEQEPVVCNFITREGMAQDMLVNKLIQSLQEIIYISDRDHDAWNKAKQLLNNLGE